MAAHWETIQVAGDPMRVYVAVPEGPGPHPGVVVAQPAGGVDTFVQAAVQWLAEAGYVAAAPDLYHRHKDSILEEVAKLPPGHPDRMPKLLSKSERNRDPEVIADIDATVEYLRSQADPQVGAIGITGFCGGGRITYLMASQNPAFRAAGVFYGANIMVARGAEQSPFDLTSQIGCPIIGFFGDDDRNPTPEEVGMMGAELTKHGKSHEFHSYPGTGHAFLDFTSPRAYREEASKDSWAKLLAFFDQHLPGHAPSMDSGQALDPHSTDAENGER